MLSTVDPEQTCGIIGVGLKQRNGGETMSTRQLLHQVKQLPIQEQLQLAQQILTGLVQQMPATELPKQLQPLLGLWQGFTITEEDISEARSELWGRLGERDF